jgi:hypothetical protein
MAIERRQLRGEVGALFAEGDLRYDLEDVG